MQIQIYLVSILGNKVEERLEDVSSFVMLNVEKLPVSTFDNDVPYVSAAQLNDYYTKTETHDLDLGDFKNIKVPYVSAAQLNDYYTKSAVYNKNEISDLPVSTFDNDVPYLVKADLKDVDINLGKISGFIADHLCYYHVGAIFPYLGTTPPRGTLALNRSRSSPS